MSINNRTTFQPFIKWVGGKRQLIKELVTNLPQDFNNYYEPFIGGGALLLSLSPKMAYINDFNTELVCAWQAVQSYPTELLDDLIKYQEKNSKEFYLDIRKMDRDGRLKSMSSTQRGARFIYLNKTGFNGIWRVNSKGQNNVPYAGKTNVNLTSYDYQGLSHYLKESVSITQGDYQKAVANAQPNDLVYFDPPYIPVSSTASFTSYTTSAFGFKQQQELATLAFNLTRKGVHVMVSNSDVPLIRSLYPESIFKIHHVLAKRMINSVASKRGPVGEVIITNY